MQVPARCLRELIILCILSAVSTHYWCRQALEQQLSVAGPRTCQYPEDERKVQKCLQRVGLLEHTLTAAWCMMLALFWYTCCILLQCSWKPVMPHCCVTAIISACVQSQLLHASKMNVHCCSCTRYLHACNCRRQHVVKDSKHACSNFTKV